MLILDLSLRGGDVAKKLEETGERITETLTSRSASVTDTLRESVEQFVDTVATRGDAMKDMLSTRLAAFEEVFGHSGAELGEKISRDSATLGNLITRHLAEFDRTVKTYGSELVERLGARTQDVSESMRGYVESFDNRVTAKASEVTTALDQRLSRFQEALDGRTQTLTDALSGRVMDIAKTLAEGARAGNLQGRQRFDLWPECQMQLQRDVRVLGRVLRGAFHSHLIEGDLLGALAGHILVMNGFDAEVFLRGRIHVMAGGDAVEHVGFEHGIELLTVERYAVVRQNVGVVLQAMSELRPGGIFEVRLDAASVFSRSSCGGAPA